MPRFLYSQAEFQGQHFYVNLDSGVGSGRPNKADDVIIVQFFLEALRPRWGGAVEVKRDGIVGRGTTDAILAFQNYILNTYGADLLIPDSAVDPTSSPAHYVASTLGWMHEEYIATFPEHWPDVRTHPAWGALSFVGFGLFW